MYNLFNAVMETVLHYLLIYITLIEPEKKLGSDETIKIGVKAETKLDTVVKQLFFNGTCKIN